jgi:ribonuclease BN (tRNA processing enzyme)
MQDGAKRGPIDLLFLGTGNAFGANGSAFNSFILNGKYLFDVGPTALQQLHKSRANPLDIEVVMVSHFHADHFFGLPFLFLEFWRHQRTNELVIAGPPGIAERAEGIWELGFPGMPPRSPGYKRRYIEVCDGMEAEAAGLEFTAAEVDHVPSLQCFGYRAHTGGRTLMYSGDSKMCDGLLKLAPGAEALVLDCSHGGDPVHLSVDDVNVIRGKAAETATTIVSHLDGKPIPSHVSDVLVASDLARFRL